MSRKLLTTAAVAAMVAVPLLAGGQAATAKAGPQWVPTATHATQVMSVVGANRDTFIQPRYRTMVMHAVSTGGMSHLAKVYQASRNLGPLAASTRLNLVVGLRLRNQSGLMQLIKDEATPGNPLFGHYLTPAQSKADFGPTASSVHAVVSYLHGQGFTGLQVSANNLLVTASATAQQAEQAFNTHLDRFLRTDASGAHATVSTVFANTTAAEVPASLGGTVLSVVGLNNASSLHLVHPALSVPTNPLYHLNAAQYQSAYDATGAEDPTQCLTSSIGTPPVSYPQCEAPKTATTTGGTTTTAIMTAGFLGNVVKTTVGGVNDGTDLSLYEMVNNLPYEPVTIRCPGQGSNPCSTIQPAATDADYQGEFDLDTQTSSGIAGGVQHLYVYDVPAPLADANIVQEFNLFQSDDLAKAGSASFGGCESSSFLDGSMVTIDEALGLAAGQGQTMFASTGDTAGSCSIGIPNGVPLGAEGQVEYPASSPFVVGAGGTTLLTNQTNAPADGSCGAPCTYNHEVVWYAGGGGDSLFEYEPSWQTDVVPPLSTATCTVAYGVCFGKGLPDVSMDADPNTGADVYLNGAETTVGGTSLSSPLSLGSWARLNSSYLAFLAANPSKAPASPNFAGLPFAAPLLYSFYTPLNANGVPAPGVPAPQGSNYPLHDVIDGGNPPFVAYPGWDYGTGLGTFDLAQVNYAIQHSSQVTAVPLPTVPNPTCTLGSDTSVGDAGVTNPATGQTLVSNNALDISAIGLRSSTGGTTGQSSLSIIGQMRVVDLGGQSGLAGQPPQEGGDDWYVTFNYHGVTDFLQAQYSPSSVPNGSVPSNPTDPNNFATFTYGHLVPGTPNTYTTDGAATGSLDTANNLITIIAPASGFTYQSLTAGATPVPGGTPPALGDTLTNTGGQTDALVGTGASGGLLEKADSISGTNYTLGTVCTSSGKPTAAFLSQASATRHGSLVVFHWMLARTVGVTGFNLYAGSHQLNGHLIAVHTGPSYRFQAHVTGSAHFTLHILLRSGRQVVTSIR